ncbi:Transcription factor [Nymphaea thermarum]|nr:Transcription factor [Nymphaea thermarum]
MKIIKGASEEDEDEEEEFMDRSREIKRESSSQHGDVAGKSDGRSSEQRANTPRSKHSATEQRRRSKINDRQVSAPANFCCRLRMWCPSRPCLFQYEPSISQTGGGEKDGI